MAIHSDLNPNADPFLYRTPLDPPPKKQPIFNLSHQFSLSKTLIPPPQPQQHPGASVPAVGWPPVHGYVYSVEPTSRWQFYSPMLSCTDVNSQNWFPSSAGFYGRPENGWISGEVKGGRKVKGVAQMGPRRSQRRLKIEKKMERKETSGAGDAILAPPTSGEVMSPELETTTVMIKNVPNQFRRHDLLNILNKHCRMENKARNGVGADCCRTQYDFLYLPMDFWRYWVDGKVSNLGYAFVNFTTAAAASKFCAVYHRREWEVKLNKKVCEVTRAKIQGVKALMEAFRDKIFWCHSMQYLPVKLEPASDGCRSYRAMCLGKRVHYMPPKHMKKKG